MLQHGNWWSIWPVRWRRYTEWSLNWLTLTAVYAVIIVMQQFPSTYAFPHSIFQVLESLENSFGSSFWCVPRHTFYFLSSRSIRRWKEARCHYHNYHCYQLLIFSYPGSVVSTAIPYVDVTAIAHGKSHWPISFWTFGKCAGWLRTHTHGHIHVVQRYNAARNNAGHV